MKKYLVLLMLLIATPAFAVTQFTVNVPTSASDLKSNFPAESIAQYTIMQTLLQNYQQGYVVSYNSSTVISISSGEVTAWNGSAAIFLQNSGSQTATTSNLDTGASFNPATTYYVYAGASSGTAATSTISISLNSTTPSNLTWYKQIGSFTTDGSSNIVTVINNSKVASYISAYGTISSGATISLPTGFAAPQCAWIISPASIITGNDSWGGPANAQTTLTANASASRVVTVSSDDGRSHGATGTASYLISCSK